MRQQSKCPNKNLLGFCLEKVWEVSGLGPYGCRRAMGRSRAEGEFGAEKSFTESDEHVPH